MDFFSVYSNRQSAVMILTEHPRAGFQPHGSVFIGREGGYFPIITGCFCVPAVRAPCCDAGRSRWDRAGDRDRSGAFRPRIPSCPAPCSWQLPPSPSESADSLPTTPVRTDVCRKDARWKRCVILAISNSVQLCKVVFMHQSGMLKLTGMSTMTAGSCIIITLPHTCRLREALLLFVALFCL